MENEPFYASVSEDSARQASLLLSHAHQTLDVARREIEGSGADAALARGKVFELVGYFPEAAAAYGEAIAHKPGLIEARARQALSYLKAGYAVRGLELATELAASHGDFRLKTLATGEEFSVMTILGDALVMNNRADDATAAYKIARGSGPVDNYATAHLAQVHLSRNEQEAAGKLADALPEGSRFSALKTVLDLGKISEALLPNYNLASLARRTQIMLPGRPMVVDGAAQFAETVVGRSDWCADLPQEA